MGKINTLAGSYYTAHKCYDHLERFPVLGKRKLPRGDWSINDLAQNDE
jgi:hypothetical protein